MKKIIFVVVASLFIATVAQAATETPKQKVVRIVCPVGTE